MILNEYRQVIWWGALTGSESIKEMKPHLQRLKTRHDNMGKEVKAIFVDNCCNVRKSLNAIFPDVAVVLDKFHWHKRWDSILRDKKSPEARIFKGCIRRCISVVEDNEYKAKKAELHERLKRPPTVKEILKECNTTFPELEAAKNAVVATVNLFILADTQQMTVAALQDANKDAALQDANKDVSLKLVFKGLKDVKTTLQQRMPDPTGGCSTIPQGC